MITRQEPYCNHDAPAVYDGVCECGAPLTSGSTTQVRNATNAELLAELEYRNIHVRRVHDYTPEG